MIDKRFTYDSKTVGILKDGEFWLDGNVDTACNHSEICNELNQLNDENEQLKQEVNHWKKMLNDYHQMVAKTLREQYHFLKNENKILKHDKIVALLELEAIAKYLGFELE